jgi:hypothetical protein
MASVFKIRIRNNAGFDALVKAIHFRHDTGIRLDDGDSFISDPAFRLGFEEGQRMILVFDRFNEKLKLSQIANINANFFDIEINPGGIAFAVAAPVPGGGGPF